jgi:predicted TIM-barrel fold metal-dependent hydrolase
MDLVPGIPPSILEFEFDTTRAISSLLYSGTLSRCLDIKFIFSHGGGTAPFLADRIASLVRRPNYPELRERIPKGVDYELGKLYYDVVSIAGNPPGFQALKGIAANSHILFGTDFPFYRIEHAVDGLAKCGLTEADLAAINHQNAAALFPVLLGLALPRDRANNIHKRGGRPNVCYVTHRRVHNFAGHDGFRRLRNRRGQGQCGAGRLHR